MGVDAVKLTVERRGGTVEAWELSVQRPKKLRAPWNARIARSQIHTKAPQMASMVRVIAWSAKRRFIIQERRLASVALSVRDASISAQAAAGHCKIQFRLL